MSVHGNCIYGKKLKKNLENKGRKYTSQRIKLWKNLQGDNQKEKTYFIQDKFMECNSLNEKHLNTLKKLESEADEKLVDDNNAHDGNT